MKLNIPIKVLILFVVTLMVAMSCNRSSSKSSGLMHKEYHITLEEGYGKKYLLKLYPDLIDQIGRTSKSENVYFVTFKELVNQDSIAKQPHVLSVVVQPEGLAPPKTIKGKKGTARPIQQ